jgi:hypothetical protein
MCEREDFTSVLSFYFAVKLRDDGHFYQAKHAEVNVINNKRMYTYLLCCVKQRIIKLTLMKPIQRVEVTQMSYWYDRCEGLRLG